MLRAICFSIFFLAGMVLASTSVMAQQSLLSAGPMVGPSEMREVQLWLQTTEPADVHIVYRDTAAPYQEYSTNTVRTRRETAGTATLVADSVEPGRTYEYTVMINARACEFEYATQFSTQPIWKYRGNDVPQMTMMIGSCFYVNEEGYERWNRDGEESGYGSEFEILASMHAEDPDVMVWLGDNTYLREADWNSRSGFLKRYSHTRAYPGLQPFLASTAHYAIWDDHDFGPNNSNETFWGKDVALEAHQLFWPAPSYGVMGMPGITSTFEMLDVQVFLLDDRYYRTAQKRKDGEGGEGGEGVILGERQVEWLIGALASSTATFKIIAVGSQFLTTDLRKECFMHVPEERQRIIDAITENEIKGVLFITGDVHGAELSKLEREGTYPLYEFTSSALTAGSNKNIADQPNDNRVEGTAFGGHNYGTITVSGTRRKRQLTLKLFRADGSVEWERVIEGKELK